MMLLILLVGGLASTFLIEVLHISNEWLHTVVWGAFVFVPLVIRSCTLEAKSAAASTKLDVFDVLDILFFTALFFWGAYALTKSWVWGLASFLHVHLHSHPAVPSWWIMSTIATVSFVALVAIFVICLMAPELPGLYQFVVADSDRFPGSEYGSELARPDFLPKPIERMDCPPHPGKSLARALRDLSRAAHSLRVRYIMKLAAVTLTSADQVPASGCATS